MALILLIFGAILFYSGRFSLGDINVQGRHVKAAGVVLMLPSSGSLVLILLVGMFFGGNTQFATSLLQIISLAEFLALFGAIAVAYILLMNPPNAPRLPGILGEIQAGIGNEAASSQPSTSPAHSAQRPSPAREQVAAKRIMSLPEAAVYLGMTEGQVEQLIDEGKLPAARNNYHYQIARSQLDEILKLRSVELA